MKLKIFKNLYLSGEYEFDIDSLKNILLHELMSFKPNMISKLVENDNINKVIK